MNLNKKHSGFTLLELMITIIIASIVMLGLGTALVDGHRGYEQLRKRIHSEVVQDAYVSRIAFDAIARKATTQKYDLDEVGHRWVKLYYFSDPNVADIDRSAKFAFDVSKEELTVTYHDEKNNSPLGSQTLATTVQDAWFDMPSVCAQMQLELDNGKESLIVTCSSIRHNEE